MLVRCGAEQKVCREDAEGEEEAGEGYEEQGCKSDSIKLEERRSRGSTGGCLPRADW